MIKEWLVEQVDPVEVEKEHTLLWFKKPFGAISGQWEIAKEHLVKGGNFGSITALQKHGKIYVEKEATVLFNKGKSFSTFILL